MTQATNTSSTYATINDLPATIRDVLPPAAQELYLEIYNEAMSMEFHTGTQSMSRESMAHQLAWDAVMREFVHDDRSGQWYRKGEEPVEEEQEHKGIMERIRNIF